MQTFRRSYLDALKEIEHGNPIVSEMISYAQRHDPSSDRYVNFDLLLYRNILRMIPESVRITARQGYFSNRHPATLRDTMGSYLSQTENYPVEFSFIDNNLQQLKEKMDYALYKLVDELNTNTFIDKERYEVEIYYYIPPEWQMSQEGSERYIKAEKNINELSSTFIESFDNLHRLCRNKFLE